MASETFGVASESSIPVFRSRPINEDAENVLEVINEFAGVLPFDDKASPEVIQREFGLSKGAFKRAIGHLMKEGKVEIKDKRIYAK